jgi:hypothetical protein
MQLIQVNLRLFSIIVLLLFGKPLFAQQDPSFNPQFLLSADPDAVVLTYSQIPDLIADPDTTPLVSIYADGFVLIHYPYYMKKAGDYETYISHGDLMQLLRSVAGVIDFDNGEAKQAKKNVDRSRFATTGIVTNRSDEVLERFDIKLEGYQENPSASQRVINRRVEWRDIRSDAAEYPSIADLRKLERAQASILALLERTDLNKLPKSPRLP